MPPEEPLLEKKESRLWLWTAGQRLSYVLLWLFVLASTTDFPGNRAAEVQESSSVSRSDLIKAGMTLQRELAAGKDSAETPDVFKTEGWRTLERAVADHQDHIRQIQVEQRWWHRLFGWGIFGAFVCFTVFDRLKNRLEEEQWEDDLPKGRKHLWGKIPQR